MSPTPKSIKTTQRIGAAAAVFLLLVVLSASVREADEPTTAAGLAPQTAEPTATPRVVTVAPTPTPRVVTVPPSATAVPEATVVPELAPVSVPTVVPEVTSAPEAMVEPAPTAASTPVATAAPIPTATPAPTPNFGPTAAPLPTVTVAKAPAPKPTPSQTITTTPTTTLPSPNLLKFTSLNPYFTIRDFSSYTSSGLSRWQQSVPGIEDLRIISTADGTQQPALWLAPSGSSDKPVLVILHSWSAPYTQHAGIPFAMWAKENGWAVIAPEFRGKNKNANAVGSNLAVQDAVDAIDFAAAQPGVDANRVYVVGYSGGGMMGLLLAGRHPEKVDAVSVWGPPDDLIEFYEHARRLGLGYANDIWRACGGDPRIAGSAQEQCRARSPATYLNAARNQGVPVFIAQGIRDQYVARNVAAKVFNQLAHPDHRLSAEEVAQFGQGRVPNHLSITTETYFRAGDPAAVFARKSDQVLLVYFQSGHDMVYKASARWFASDPGK